MAHRPRRSVLRFVPLLLAAAPACSDASAGGPSPAPPAERLPDSPLAGYRSELLAMAYGAASAMPLDLHAKNRARAQEQVVLAAIELGQPRKALEYVQGIGNWRRGTGYADLARYCAEHGAVDEARSYVELARDIAERPLDATDQIWRRDRVLARVAAVLRLLGRSKDATSVEAGIDDLAVARTGLAPDVDDHGTTFQEQIEGLEKLLPAGTFDQLQEAAGLCVGLFDHSYDDPARRQQADDMAMRCCERLPVQIRIETTMGLARAALAHDDPTAAAVLVDRARSLVEDATWAPETLVPFHARLAVLEHRTGDEQAARTELDAALATFEEKRPYIVDIDRADVLRALAEGYLEIGVGGVAHELYDKAVAAGVENPNSRPRADDLVATCCSMARLDFEPDEVLWRRLRAVRDGLGDPW